MTLDIFVERGHTPIVEHSVDFTKPPAAIEKYEFGEALTRNNFTDFLIKSFGSARGVQTQQAYSWVWLEKHGVNVLPTVKDFVEGDEIDGWDALVEEERGNILKAANAVKVHHREDAMRGDVSNTVEWELVPQLCYILNIIEEAGSGSVIYIPNDATVNAFNEDVFSLDKEGFQQWLSSHLQEEHLLNRLNTTNY